MFVTSTPLCYICAGSFSTSMFSLLLRCNIMQANRFYQHPRNGYAYFAQVCSTLRRVRFDSSHVLLPAYKIRTVESHTIPSSVAKKQKNGVSTKTLVPLLNMTENHLVYYQDQVIKRVKSSINHLGEAQGHLLTRRPFQVTWFSSQLAM